MTASGEERRKRLKDRALRRVAEVSRKRIWEDRPGLATAGLVNDQHRV
jgi:hypothetical protein